MTMTRRGPLERRVDILRVLLQNGELWYSQIFQKANLASIDARNQINFLLERGLLSVKDGTIKTNTGLIQIYSLTDDGRHLLKSLEPLFEAVGGASED